MSEHAGSVQMHLSSIEALQTWTLSRFMLVQAKVPAEVDMYDGVLVGDVVRAVGVHWSQSRGGQSYRRNTEVPRDQRGHRELILCPGDWAGCPQRPHLLQP